MSDERPEISSLSMARTLSFSWTFVFLLFLSGLQCDDGGQPHNRQKRDISNDQYVFYSLLLDN